MPVTEAIDLYGRRIQGKSCHCRSCTPSLGHVFDKDLLCSCGRSYQEQQREPVQCVVEAA